jgi:hypothetical protein
VDEPLLPLETKLGPLAVGDVDDDAGEADDLSRVVGEHSAAGEDLPLPTAVDHAVLAA